MKLLGVLFVLAVFIVARHSAQEMDFSVLRKLAKTLETDGKLSSSTIKPYSPEQINQMTREAVLQFVGHCKKTLLNNGTLVISQIDVQKEIKEAQSYVYGFFKDLKIQNLDSLEFFNLTTSLMNLTSEYAIYFAKDLRISGVYRMDGEFIGQRVFGDGTFDILVQGMKCAGATGAVIQDKHFHINAMESSFDMDDIRINITNFTMDQFTPDELDSLINSAAIIYIKQYREFLSELGAPVVIEYLNEKIKNYTLTELYAIIATWLGYQ